MENGDLTNEPPSGGIHVVWEGLLAVPGPKYTPRKFEIRCAVGGYRQALAMFETNQAARDQLSDLAQNGTGVSVVTYLPACLHRALGRRLDEESITHVRLIVTTLREMTVNCALDLSISQLFDAAPGRQLTYGSKGRFLTAHDAHMIGRLP